MRSLRLNVLTAALHRPVPAGPGHADHQLDALLRDIARWRREQRRRPPAAERVRRARRTPEVAS